MGNIENEPIYIRPPEKHRKPSVFIGDTPFEGSMTIAKVEGELPSQSKIRASVLRSRRSLLFKGASAAAALPLAVLLSKLK